MPAILPKDCCDCAVVVDPCNCQQDYLVTANGNYTGNLSSPLDCDNNYNAINFSFTSSFSNITNTLTIIPPTENQYLIGGFVQCQTTGSFTTVFCESTLSCSGGIKDSATINYILCGGEDSCNEVGGVETLTQQRPPAGYAGSVETQRVNSGPNEGNYTFSIGGISIITNYGLSWSADPGGTETGTLTLTQDFAPSETIQLYGTWNIGFINPTNTKSGSCNLEIDISKIV